MMLKHRKNAVIVPFLGYSKSMSFREQPARARILKELTGAQILPIGQLTAINLKKAIQKAQLYRGDAKVPAEWFLGKRNLDQEFAEFFRTA